MPPRERITKKISKVVFPEKAIADVNAISENIVFNFRVKKGKIITKSEIINVLSKINLLELKRGKIKISKKHASELTVKDLKLIQELKEML